MRFLVFVLVFLPYFLQGQTLLKAGKYQNLKPTKPIVLDTGSFTFIGLEMKGLGEGILLDARKARKLSLSHCTWIGTSKETALVFSGEFEMAFCTFKNLNVAIKYEGKGDSKVKIYRNLFEDNKTAIALHRKEKSGLVQLSMALKCNEFISNSSLDTNYRKGLVIGEGIQLGIRERDFFSPNHLGGEGRQFIGSFSYPNGNIWPDLKKTRKLSPTGIWTDIHNPDTTFGWPNASKWIAIDNQSGYEISYHHYENEFVGWGPVFIGSVLLKSAESNRKWRLEPGMSTDTCLWKIHQPIGMNNAMVCEQLVDEQPFLLPTHFSVEKPSWKPLKKKMEPYFENEPVNPAKTEISLQIWLPETASHVVLQYTKGETGEILQNNPIGERGFIKAHLDLRYIEAGEYGYRLLVDGKPLETKKMIVSKY